MPRYPTDPPRPAGAAGNGLPDLPAHLDPRGRHRSGHQPAGRKRAALAATRILATVLSTALLITFGTYWWKYHSFTSSLNRLNVISAAGKPTHDIDGSAQNILIVGNDDRSTATDAELKALHTTRDGGSLNTDTMMIVHIPANGAKAALISLPRDSYVDIPGYGWNKLNAAYAFAYNAASGTANQQRAAGANLLIQVVQQLTGLTIDHFVSVDLLGFYRISNAIGGVAVNMCAAVDEPNSGVDLHKGINVIEGTQALAFVRQRYDYPNGLGDLDRVERQRYFLTAAFRKLTSAGVLFNPIKLQNLLNAVQSSLYMDASLNVLNLARQLENLSADNIVGQTIPTDGFGNETVGSVLLVSPAQVHAFINTIVGATDPGLSSAKTVAPSTVTVNVLNGSNTNGVAAQNAQVLQGQGFAIGTVGNATSSTNTYVEYSDGMQSQAKTLSAYVPGATLTEVSGLSHVTLVLGADGLAAKAPAAHSATTAPSSAAASSSAAPKTQPPDAGCIN